MRILNLYASSIKRIDVVDITPTEDIVEITGRNGEGKTSVLDCILYALGGEDTFPANPVRKGAPRAEIRLDLGEVIVRRTWTSKGPELFITRNGNPVPRAQGFLTGYTDPRSKEWVPGILDRISFDPLKFARLREKEQAEQLRSIVKLSVDPDELDRLNKIDYDKRRELLRDKAAMEARIKAMAVEPAGVPAEPIDIGVLTAELEEAGQVNVSIEAKRAQKAQHEGRAERLTREAREIAEKIEELEKMLAVAREEQKNKQTAAVEYQAKASAIEIPEPVDTSVLRESIAQAQRDNRWIEQRRQREELTTQAERLEMEARRLTEAQDERRDAKLRAIEEAEMPVEGLSFEEGAVYFQGLPLEQASGAEQLRVSMAIAMAGNPQLRIVRIVDGSLLDDKSMELVKATARERDFQVWIERVDTTGEVGIVMAEGRVESTPETRAKAAKESTGWTNEDKITSAKKIARQIKGLLDEQSERIKKGK